MKFFPGPTALRRGLSSLALLAALAPASAAGSAGSVPSLPVPSVHEPHSDSVVSVSERACDDGLTVLTCNSGATSVLTDDDCTDLLANKFDIWQVQAKAGQTVVVNAMASGFDTWVGLYSPPPRELVVWNHDPASNNSRLVHTLDQTGEWLIEVYERLDVGDSAGPYPLSYNLSLECTPAPPSNLTATAVSATAVDLFWTDNSILEDEFRVEIKEPSGAFQDIGARPADSVAAGITGSFLPATSYDFRVRARNYVGDSTYSNVATATTPGASTSCVPDATTLCLNNNRFQVTLTWQSNTDQGVGMVARERDGVLPAGTDDTGAFWFFNSGNWEVLLKVLDACSFSNHYWVFAAATTNQAWTLRVVDTMSGTYKEYTYPIGPPAPALTDTQAFATCP